MNNAGEREMYRIMLVDDEPNVLRALERVLADPCHTVESFADPEAALHRAGETDFDLVLSDYRMPGMDGVTFLTGMRTLQPDAMRLILSAHADWQALLGAINHAEVYRFLPKPWDTDDLRLTVGRALEHRATLLDNRRLAAEVRCQREAIDRRDAALRELARTNPELARVRWGEDGSVLLEDVD